MAQKFYVDGEGRLLGSWTDPMDAPAGATAIDTPPSEGTDIWDGTDWIADVAVLIARRCREVDALRERKFADGMSYEGKVLQLGEVDQQRIIASGAQAKFALLQGAAWPPNFGWIMADNSLLPLDALGMSTMADQAAARVQAWIFIGHAHKQALRAMNNVTAIGEYDIESGW